jgi:hypothetical protein
MDVEILPGAYDEITKRMGHRFGMMIADLNKSLDEKYGVAPILEPGQDEVFDGAYDRVLGIAISTVENSTYSNRPYLGSRIAPSEGMGNTDFESMWRQRLYEAGFVKRLIFDVGSIAIGLRRNNYKLAAAVSVLASTQHDYVLPVLYVPTYFRDDHQSIVERNQSLRGLHPETIASRIAGTLFYGPDVSS